MLIGLLSDTHDRLDAMIAAMRVLRGAGAEFFIHGGDVGGEQILDCLQSPDVSSGSQTTGTTRPGSGAAFVFGNNDWERRELARYAESIGVQCLEEFGELTLEGKRFAITHGDDSARLKRIHKDQQHDYLITGHTHMKRDERIGKIRWINPGALYRAREKTVAILDTTSDVLKFLRVEV
jgi:putative phosphoesterase